MSHYSQTKGPKMRKISVVAALLFIIPSPALAADWVLVGTAVDESITLYIDTSSIKSNGSIRRYWQRIEEVNDPKVKTTLALYESNCATDQRRRLQLIIYLVDGTNESYPNLSKPWAYVAPGTGTEVAHNFVCAQ